MYRADGEVDSAQTGKEGRWACWAVPNCHGGTEEFTDQKEGERAPAQRQTDTMGEEEAAELAMSPAGAGGGRVHGHGMGALVRRHRDATDGGVRQPRSANTGATGERALVPSPASMTPRRATGPRGKELLNGRRISRYQKEDRKEER